MINLENQNSTYLIQDFVKNSECNPSILNKRVDKYLAYLDSIFYVGSKQDVKLFTLVDDIEEGSVLTVNPEESEIAIIKPEDMNIHGIIIKKNEAGIPQIMIAMETLDNQIDFNILEILRRPPGDFDYTFKQYREVV